MYVESTYRKPHLYCHNALHFQASISESSFRGHHYITPNKQPRCFVLNNKGSTAPKMIAMLVACVERAQCTCTSSSTLLKEFSNKNRFTEHRLFKNPNMLDSLLSLQPYSPSSSSSFPTSPPFSAYAWAGDIEQIPTHTPSKYKFHVICFRLLHSIVFLMQDFMSDSHLVVLSHWNQHSGIQCI